MDKKIRYVVVEFKNPWYHEYSSSCVYVIVVCGNSTIQHINKNCYFFKVVKSVPKASRRARDLVQLYRNMKVGEEMNQFEVINNIID